MISAFKHIRLSGYNLLPQPSNGNIRLSLNNSGVAYFSELSTASGILNTKIDAFSGTFQSFVNNLDATYATDAQLIAVSGALQTGINTVATNLASTGSVLNTKINSLSGTLTDNYYLKSNPSGFITSENVLYTTGNQTIVGSKTFTASRYVFSGADVIFTNNTGIVSGEWRFANRPTVNGTGVLLSGEAATLQNLATTGSTLDTKINSLSGYSNNTFTTITSFSTFTGNLAANFATDAELTAVSGTLQTGINTVATNLASTGSTLNTKINSLSGYSDGRFATITNLATTGSTLDTKINSLSGNLTSTYATITNLASTGSTLNTKIDNLSGYSNNTFTTITSFSTFTGNLAANFATDAELTAVSGTLQTGINTVATNLASTGSTLNTKINSLSGNLTATYATITNLASTGSTLDTKINNLSGTLSGEYVRRATQQQFIVTLPINVESTGILFPVAFASTPNSVQVTFEPSTDVAYMVAVKNRTTAGFTAEFSDVLFETGNKLNVFASV